VSSLAGFYSALQSALNFNRKGTLFIILGTIVTVLVFASLDLAIKYGQVKICDNIYGLGPWLKQPRVNWVKEYTNVFAQCCKRIIHILEEGFDLFSVPSSSASTEKKNDDEHGNKTFESGNADDALGDSAPHHQSCARKQPR
jgi:hypothetical protein